MSQSLPLETVFVEFLRNLSLIVQADEPVVLVLRGSMLLRHWFGERARPAADIDLECFERVRGARGSRFTSLVDHGRGLCCYATELSASCEIEFVETDAPNDGQSLWEYGMPGERFYIGWVWSHRSNQGGQSGRLQIDIAESGSYDLKELGVTDISLTATDGDTFRIPAYAPETMLAAKLSWLVRSLKRWRNDDQVDAPSWKGESKDLFDVYLLLTQADLRADLFRQSLLAIGAEDKLEWNNLEAIFDVRRGKITDDDFANWNEFRQRHPGLIDRGPTELLQAIADRLESLLGDFYLRQEMPFLLALNADPVDEYSYLVYADWLEERGIARSHFLRLFARFYFRQHELTRSNLDRTRTELQATLCGTSLPWLHQLFGTTARFQEIRQRIEGYSAN
jgi:uncharacterized protein (TIGR02996 family)